MTFHPTTGTLTIIPHSEDIVVGEKCVIVEGDIPELKKIIAFLISECASRFNVAQRRLLLGMERKSLEDRLIDYMIGLEALYLPDTNLELSFRLSLRIAFLLRSDPSERKKLYSFIKQMYDTRSNIVHGNKYSLIENDISKLEGLLRESLKLWILDKNYFSTDRDSGILSNLFFNPEP